MASVHLVTGPSRERRALKGEINLGEFKSVMLASLRSLVKDWASLHEVSWSWLWENVERMMKKLLGKPVKQEAALSAFMGSLDEGSLMTIRREVYSKFFALAPAGQDYFKQSTTRLHFIADKLVIMTLDMYREPKRMVEDPDMPTGPTSLRAGALIVSSQEVALTVTWTAL